MGVYIKGMEMPKNCGECLFAKLNPTGENLICNYMLSRVSWEEKPFDCPLVPILPHGDLIDADMIREDWLENGKNEYVYDTNAFLSSIDDAPIIIPAEESDMDSFIHIFKEDDEEDGMDSFIRIFKD